MGPLSPKDGIRDGAVFFGFEISRSNHLVRRSIRDALQGIGDPRQLIQQLVANSGSMHDHDPSPAELLHDPCCEDYSKDRDCEELFLRCYGDGAAENMKYMLREQIFLPAGNPTASLDARLGRRVNGNSLVDGYLSLADLPLSAALP